MEMVQSKLNPKIMIKKDDNFQYHQTFYHLFDNKKFILSDTSFQRVLIVGNRVKKKYDSSERKKVIIYQEDAWGPHIIWKGNHHGHAGAYV